ncbi:DUF2202 domain-containing protein [Humibacillus xanthopallidus]|uniref:DUF2202 domain-containing protein n=1 Tax=Humibacillus xanthopallidus TaxID=412689 RepID=UPI00384D0E2E
MNTTWRNRTAVIAGAALILAGGAAVSAGASTGVAPTSVVATATATDPALAKGLAFTREEERMARDLYQALADHYDGALPFSRIVTSEQRHFDAVGTMLERYSVTDPAAGKQAGSYADPTIQKLYDGWLAEGKTSLAAAYGVGVELETRDIADLEKAIAATSAADVKQLYTNLQRASEHHLAAFEAAVDGRTLGTGMGTGMGAGMNGQGQMGRGNGNANGNGSGQGRMGSGLERGPGAGNAGDCPLEDSAS